MKKRKKLKWSEDVPFSDLSPALQKYYQDMALQLGLQPVKWVTRKELEKLYPKKGSKKK